MRGNGPPRRTVLSAIVGSSAILFALHWITPTGPHTLHWLHLMFQKLYYLPILFAAAWLGVRATMLTAAWVSILLGIHILVNWAGDPMQQADQVGEIVSYWAFAVVSAILFSRQRRALEETRKAHTETLTALASTLDLREHDTAQHSRRVQGYTVLMAQRMGIREEAVLENLRMGALLHDVGKIGVPDEVLLKNGRLGEDELAVIRRHPEQGAALVGEIGFLSGARELVHAHHEKFDGTGYPQGLSGESIPLGARIFAVADVFDALTSSRPYRRASSWREGSEVIRGGRGTQFDPAIVDVFLAVPYRELAIIASEWGEELSEGVT